MIVAAVAATLLSVASRNLPEQPADGVRTRYAAGSCAYGYYPYSEQQGTMLVLTPTEALIVENDQIYTRKPYYLHKDNTISFADGWVRYKLTCIIGGPASLQEYAGNQHTGYALIWRDPAEAKGDR